MKHQRFSLALLSIVAITAITAPLFALREERQRGIQSVTRVDDLEITGTTDASGEVTAQSGMRLTTVTTGPIVTSGIGSPDGAVNGTLGSLYLQTDTAAVFQNTDGATAWTELGAGAGDSWELVIDDPLTGGALTGWTQRDCAWTADGTGFHTTGGTECFLSYESAGLENAPFPMDGVIMEFEASWGAASPTTDLLGAVVIGQAASVATSGTVRMIMRRDGTQIGISGYPANTAVISTGLGTLPVSTWYQFRLVLVGTTCSFWFNNVFYGTFSVTAVYPGTRVGLWVNGRGDFRNLKIYRRNTSP